MEKLLDRELKERGGPGSVKIVIISLSRVTSVDTTALYQFSEMLEVWTGTKSRNQHRNLIVFLAEAKGEIAFVVQKHFCEPYLQKWQREGQLSLSDCLKKASNLIRVNRRQLSRVSERSVPNISVGVSVHQNPPDTLTLKSSTRRTTSEGQTLTVPSASVAGVVGAKSLGSINPSLSDYLAGSGAASDFYVDLDLTSGETAPDKLASLLAGSSANNDNNTELLPNSDDTFQGAGQHEAGLTQDFVLKVINTGHSLHSEYGEEDDSDFEESGDSSLSTQRPHLPAVKSGIIH